MHLARGDVDDGLEQRLEAVVLDGVGQRALELLVVEQPLALGGLHGRRHAVLQRLLEGELVRRPAARRTVTNGWTRSKTPGARSFRSIDCRRS